MAEYPIQSQLSRQAGLPPHDGGQIPHTEKINADICQPDHSSDISQ